MTKQQLFLSGSLLAVFVATSTAHAQMRFSDVDSDGNGRLSYNELQSAFGTSGANQLWERGGGRELSRSDIRSINTSRDDDDDDGSRGGGGGSNDNDDDDDGGSRGGGGSNDNDDDDDGGSRGGGGGSNDDDDDGGSGGGGGGGGGSDDNDDDD